ncbi:MAG: divergent polysaccharide deacetylase family protein [Desulfovibrio sp.]|jgi:polysaccharide deacetylase 2 family uncharacterized protein YibQ|nr:divergent polysaccharide deacetylase family protein [Desulfovibrio sp.]
MSAKGPASGKRESARRIAGKKRGRRKSKGGRAAPLILAFIAGLLVAGAGIFLSQDLSFPEFQSPHSAKIPAPPSVAPGGRAGADKSSAPGGKRAPIRKGETERAKTRLSVSAAPPVSTGAGGQENQSVKPPEEKIPASAGPGAAATPPKSPGATGREASDPAAATTSKAPSLGPETSKDAAGEDALALAMAQLQALPFEENLPRADPAPSPEEGSPFPYPAGQGAGGEPCLVIVMDDLGASRQALEQLLSLDYPVTFAFWPHGTATRSGSAQARAKGREVIIHQPMEPLGYPAVRPGPNVLMNGMNPEQIRIRLQAALDAVPGAQGLNNHMGSRFTQNREGVRVVADFLRERGLFLLDSFTHPRSVFGPEGRRAGAEVYSRDVFLDALPGREKVLEELRRAEAIALRRGWAVAIGHPLPGTLIALKDYERLRDRNIRLVRLRDLSVTSAFRKAHDRAASRFAATGGRPPE